MSTHVPGFQFSNFSAFWCHFALAKLAIRGGGIKGNSKHEGVKTK